VAAIAIVAITFLILLLMDKGYLYVVIS
jgi:hypothetical protein